MVKTKLFPKLNNKQSASKYPNNSYNGKHESSTPPCTPSPERQAPKILVEPMEKNEDKMIHNNRNHNSSNTNKSDDSYDDDDEYTYSYDDNSTLISDLSSTQYTSTVLSHNSSIIGYKSNGKNNSKNRTNRNVSTFPFQDPGSLLDTVVASCIPNLTITNYGFNFSSSRLPSIKEENSAVEDYFWGLAPSDDDTFSDNGADEIQQHDNIELVYQEGQNIPPPPKLPSSLGKNTKFAITENQAPNPVLNNRQLMESELLKRWRYCQPCDEDKNPSNEGTSIPKESNNTMERDNNNIKTNKNKDKGNKNYDLSHNLMKNRMVSKKSKKEKQIDQKKSETQQSNQDISAKLSMDKAASNSNSEKSSSISTTSGSKEGIKKVFRVAGAIGKKFSRKNRKKWRKKTKSKKKRGHNVNRIGRWKATTDPNTKKVYFYHSGTKEVSWDKPPGFIEWRAIFDINSKQHYYYNLISKETTWEQPSDFEEWRTIQDPRNPDKVYYRNVLTKERRWDKPPSTKKGNVEQNNDEETSTELREPSSNQEINTSHGSIEDRSTKSSENKENREERMEQKEQTQTSATSVIDVIDDEDTMESTIDTTRSSKKSPHTKRALAPSASSSSEFKNTKQIQILHLLSKHNPDNAKLNSEFIQNLIVGREERVIDELEEMLEEVPFDGLATAIQSYLQNNQHVNTNCRTSANDNYDVTKIPSLHRTLTLTSHRTNFSTVSMSSRIKSNMTETTNKVSNTTSRRQFQSNRVNGRTKKIQETTYNLEDSLEEEDDLSQITPTSLTSNDAETTNISTETPLGEQNVQFDNIDHVVNDINSHQVELKEKDGFKSTIHINSETCNQYNRSPKKQMYSSSSKSDSDSGILLDYDSSYAADDDIKSPRDKNPDRRRVRGKNRRNTAIGSEQGKNKDMFQRNENNTRIQEKQSELEGHISGNNWDAVAQYIAKMRNDKDSETANQQRIETRYNSSRNLQIPRTLSHNGEILFRKRFGARSLAQYDENEKVRPDDDFEDVDESCSWDERSDNSESTFSLDITVETEPEDSYENRGITTQKESKFSHSSQRYGNQQYV